MNRQITVNELVRYLLNEYERLEGKEAVAMLERISFIQSVKSKLYFENLKERGMNNEKSI